MHQMRILTMYVSSLVLRLRQKILKIKLMLDIKEVNKWNHVEMPIEGQIYA
jgi:hypothetical protein